MSIIWAKQALTSNGWEDNVSIVVAEDGRIQSITPNTKENGYRVGMLIPAPVNAHSHAFQRAMAGLTEKRGPNPTDTFWTWRQLMYKFLDRLTPEHVETIAAFVQLEMLEAGYGTNVEFHYIHHQTDGTPYDNLTETSDRIIAATAQTGIGLTLLPVHYQYGGCDKRDLGVGQVRFGNDGARFTRLYEDAKANLKALPSDTNIGVAPHSLRAVAPEDLQQTLQLAGNGPKHIHLAEQVAEVEEILLSWGKRPVEWLLENTNVNDQWCLIHCTQMEEHETIDLAQTGAVAGLCPITESSLGDGIFDGVRWMDAGGKISIGSDSNIRISLSEEIRTLDYSQRLRDKSRAALATSNLSTGRRLFEEISKGGAQAAGRGRGCIAVGEWADLTSLDGTHIHLDGLSGDTILDSYIFAGDDSLVLDVWSAGRHVVKEGQHIKGDEIRKKYKSTLAELRSDL